MPTPRCRARCTGRSSRRSGARRPTRSWSATSRRSTWRSPTARRSARPRCACRPTVRPAGCAPLDVGEHTSASLAWLAAVARLAAATVGAGLVAPRIRHDRDMPVARWVPVPDATADAALAALAAAMPPICVPTPGDPATVADIHAAMVDSLARHRLADRDWRAPLPSSRDPAMSAARSVLRALAVTRPPDRRQRRRPPGGARRAGGALRAPRAAPAWRARRAAPRPPRRARRPLRRLGGAPRARRRARPRPLVLGRRRLGRLGAWPSRSPAAATTCRAWQAEITALAETVAGCVEVAADLAREHEPVGPRARRRGRRALPRAGAGRARGARHRARRPGAPRARRRHGARPGDAPGRRRPRQALRTRGRRRLAPRRRRRRRSGGDLRRRARARRARRRDAAAQRPALGAHRPGGDAPRPQAARGPRPRARAWSMPSRCSSWPATASSRRRHRVAPPPTSRRGPTSCWPGSPTSGSRRSTSRPGSSASCARTSGAASPGCVPRAPRARRVPRRRHGPRQDGHDAGPPARPARTAPRRVPAVRRPQLAGRGGALRAGAAGRRPPRRRAGRAGARRRRPRRHDLRAAAARRRAPRRGRVVDRRRRRGAGHQEPRHPRGEGDAHAAGRPEARPHGHAGREPPRRPVGDPRRRQPGDARQPRALPAPLRQADRARRRRRGGRPAAAHHPTVRAAPHEGRPLARPRPAGQDRADRVGRADPRAGRAVPARGRPAARRCRRGHRHEAARPGARRADPPQADLQPPGPRPRRRLAARRPLGQAGPLRRAGRRAPRRRRAGARVHAVPRDGRAARAPRRRAPRAARRRSSTAASPGSVATRWSPTSRPASGPRCCSCR